ncbi:jg16967 [Pararge aegeria aegeria]|uniref:Jg16967 protein n=1 Tax=Pararge aegeria aegeria TaxID=348720 RepID=A0A8S4RJG3_9NEOP|nr:jg16967 [Pararge aegeria aegeria]
MKYNINFLHGRVNSYINEKDYRAAICVRETIDPYTPAKPYMERDNYILRASFTHTEIHKLEYSRGRYLLGSEVSEAVGADLSVRVACVMRRWPCRHVGRLPEKRPCVLV